MPFSFKPTQAEPNVKAEAEVKVATPATVTVPVFSTNANRIQVPPSPIGGMPLNEREETPKISFFRILLYVILGILVFTAVALFGYQRYLISSIDSQKKDLDEKDNTVGSINLEQMRSLSNRIKVVSQILNEHTSVNTAFIILEKSIENPITYKSFELTKNILTKNYDLKITGTAPSYKSIAQQIDTFDRDEFKDYISAIDYDNPSLDTASGRINFSLKMTVLILGKLPENVLPKSKEIVDIPKTGTTTIPNATSSVPIKASTTPN